MKLRPPIVMNRASPQAKGLLFWGPGGSGSGNLFDFSGNADNGNIFVGTIPATGRWVPGVDGGKSALSYDGGTNQTILVNSAPWFGQNRPALSIALWVKVSDITRYHYLFVNWGTANGSDSWHLRIEQTTGFVYFTHSSNGNYTSSNDLTGVTNCVDGKWHHIVATRDSGPGVSSIYIDGKLNATTAAIGLMCGLPFSLVCMGGLSDGNVTGNWLKGSIDDPRLYNYALPVTLIREMYAPATRWNLRARVKKYPFLSAPPASLSKLVGPQARLVGAGGLVG